MPTAPKDPSAPPTLTPLTQPAWAACGALFVGLGALYFFTLAPGLTWANSGADGGDLITAAATLGVAHPTGYPTFVLLAKLFQLLFPIGDLARRTAFLSLVSTLLAVAVLYRVVLKVQNSATSAWLAAAAFGAGQLVWSQAVIAEVHGLNALFVALTLWAIARLLDFEQPLAWGDVVLALCLGLGGGNHITLAFVGLAWLAALGWRFRQQRVSFRYALSLLCVVLAGLSIYLYLPLRASAHPPVNWGNPVTWEGLWWLLSGQIYRQYAFALPQAYFPQRLAAWATQLRDQFGLLGVTLGLYGLFFASFRRPLFGWAVAWMTAIYTGFALAYNTYDSQAYLIPAMMGGAVWIGLGGAHLADEAHRWGAQQKWGPFAPTVTRWGVIVLVVGAMLWAIPLTYRTVDTHADETAQAFVQRLVTEPPPGALLLTSGDKDTFATWYVVYALEQRSDLTPIVTTMLVFDWYRSELQQRYPDLKLPTGEPTIEALQTLNPRAVCETSYPEQEFALPDLHCYPAKN